jgi:Txe/YoeB family toxin of Txe-Axe toxin-antitoxin module
MKVTHSTKMVNGVPFSTVYKGMNVARLERINKVLAQVESDMYWTVGAPEEINMKIDTEFQKRLDRLATKADFNFIKRIKGHK